MLAKNFTKTFVDLSFADLFSGEGKIIELFIMVIGLSGVQFGL